VKAYLLFILAWAASAGVGAQEWYELNTLTFTPVSANSTLSSAAASEAGAAGAAGRPLSGPDDQSAFAGILAAIAAVDEEQVANGENSPGLVPLLRELARLYRESGDYPDALVALERAQDIVRRWEGLYSLEQVELIEAMIEIEMAIVPSEESDSREFYLRQLVQRNPGDPRNVEILTEMAGRQMDVARYVLVNGVPPEFVITSSVTPRSAFMPLPPSRTTGSVATSMLRRARASYAGAMQEALASGQETVSRLLELEGSIIDTFYFELMNPKLRRRDQPHWAVGALRFGGRRALEARLDNSRRFPGTPEAVSNALLELADWHLMFGAFGDAMDTYQAALANLEDHGVPDDQVMALFSPETPVALPAISSNINVYSSHNDAGGFIDVELEINRFGRVRDIEVVGVSGAAADAVVRRLRRFVYKSRFRPRYVDGDWLRSDRFVQRYEFGY